MIEFLYVCNPAAGQRVQPFPNNKSTHIHIHTINMYQKIIIFTITITHLVVSTYSPLMIYTDPPVLLRNVSRGLSLADPS